MKAYLVFNMDDHDERDLHDVTIRAMHYKIVLDEFAEWLRRLNKHEDIEVIEIEKVREEFNRLREYWDVY